MRTLPALLRLMTLAVACAPLAWTRKDRGARLARALQGLGPAAIKLGQVLATRPDIVGADAAEALSHLQDRLPAFAAATARAMVEEALHAPLDQLFAEFGEAVAAASIAQVHKARTLDGRWVAVKVLRPGIAAAFARDLNAFAFAARLAERFSAEARRLRLAAVVETLRESVAIELDLRMEAAAASEVAENVAQDRHFAVPAVDWRRSAKAVLTTDWVEGIPLRDAEALRNAGFEPKVIAVRMMRQFLKMALHDGFFHADFHPGNLFVTAGGRIVAVDFGIMGRLDVATRRFMAEVLMGFLSRDYARVAEAHFAYGTVSRDHDIDLFAQTLRGIVEPIFGHPSKDVSIADLLQRLFETTRKFGMQTQPQLILLQKTMVVSEGVARSLDPDFDMWQAGRPIAEGWLREQAGPLAKLKEVSNILRALAKLFSDWAKNAHSRDRL